MLNTHLERNTISFKRSSRITLNHSGYYSQGQATQVLYGGQI